MVGNLKDILEQQDMVWPTTLCNKNCYLNSKLSNEPSWIPIKLPTDALALTERTSHLKISCVG